MAQSLQASSKWLAVFAIVFSVSACGRQTSLAATPVLTSTPVLEATRLTALIFGKLALEDGCLRILEENSGTSYLIAWPPDFSVHTEQDRVKVIKENGEEVTLWIGEEIRLSGGEVGSRDFLSAQVQTSLPAQCSGPYWVAGLEVGPVTATSAVTTQEGKVLALPSETPRPYRTATAEPTPDPAVCTNLEHLSVGSTEVQKISSDLIAEFAKEKGVSVAELAKQAGRSSIGFEQIYSVDRIGDYVIYQGLLNVAEGAIFVLQESDQGYRLLRTWSGPVSYPSEISDYFSSELTSAPPGIFSCIDYPVWTASVVGTTFDPSYPADCSRLVSVPVTSDEGQRIAEGILLEWARITTGQESA